MGSATPAPTPWHLRALKSVAVRADRVTAAAAERALDKLHEANKARAMQDPAYAALEAKRHRADGTSIMIDEEAGLGPAEWEGQFQIFTSVARHPWWEKTARTLADKPLTRAVDARIFRRQRAVRGWDETATWNLDMYLCEHIAALLDHLADTSHGWPSGDDYPTFEDWQAALRSNAAKLRAYAAGVFTEDTATTENLTKEAGEALLWVANHHSSLWD